MLMELEQRIVLTLHSVPRQLLQVGNIINRQRQGPRAREARAFKLSSLGKFADMRTADKSLSLLDVVVEALEIDCPRHCDEV